MKVLTKYVFALSLVVFPSSLIIANFIPFTISSLKGNNLLFLALHRTRDSAILGNLPAATFFFLLSQSKSCAFD
jgi:hypothetical protein